MLEEFNLGSLVTSMRVIKSLADDRLRRIPSRSFWMIEAFYIFHRCAKDFIDFVYSGVLKFELDKNVS